MVQAIAYWGLVAVAMLVLQDPEQIPPVVAIAWIPAEVPVLILAGLEDPVTCTDGALVIADHVRSHGKLIFFEHCRHMNFPETEPGLYQRSVLGFLSELKKQAE
jgi:uncharacterized protein